MQNSIQKKKPWVQIMTSNTLLAELVVPPKAMEVAKWRKRCAQSSMGLFAFSEYPNAVHVANVLEPFLNQTAGLFNRDCDSRALRKCKIQIELE